MRRIPAVVVLALVLLAALIPAPASADSGTIGYARGDAPAAIDLTRLHVRNADVRATMTAGVRDLRESGRFTFHYWRGRVAAPPARSLLVVVRRVGGETRSRFFACGREDCAPEPCAGMRAAWRPLADTVAVSVPQRCYPRAGGTDPPRFGRFFVWSQRGSDVDDPQRGPLTLTRG